MDGKTPEYMKFIKMIPLVELKYGSDLDPENGVQSLIDLVTENNEKEGEGCYGANP